MDSKSPSKTIKEEQIYEDNKLLLNPLFPYYSKRLLYAAWNAHNIYTYVKLYVYTVNEWIGTVYLVMQLYEK